MKMMNTLPLVLAASITLLGTSRAELNISGGANLEAILTLAEKEINSGKDISEITDEQRAQYEQFKSLVEEAGLKKVSFVVAGTSDAPEFSMGLAGNKAAIKDAIQNPDSPFAKFIKRDPAGGENDFILVADSVEAGPAAAINLGGTTLKLDEDVLVTMVEADDTIYLGMRGQDPTEIAGSRDAKSILPGQYERLWHVQGGLPANVKTAIMSGIQNIMNAGGDNPQAGQMMMIAGMAMPVITDLSDMLEGIDTLALGFLIAPDDHIVLDVAHRHTDAGDAGALGASLADGSYKPTGLAEVVHAFAIAPGVESKHMNKGDLVFHRIMWSTDSMDKIGEAVTGKGMEYFQKLMGSGGTGIQIAPTE